MTFDLDGMMVHIDPIYSSSKVKVIGQNSRLGLGLCTLRDETSRPWLKSRPEFETLNK